MKELRNYGIKGLKDSLIPQFAILRYLNHGLI